MNITFSSHYQITKRVRAFSIVELLIAVSIIGILSAVVVTNFTDQRVKARDVERKTGVTTYKQAMQNYKNIQGNYFVYSTKKGSNNCTAQYDAAAPNNQYGLHGAATIAGGEDLSCAGYKPLNFTAADGTHYVSGGGEGRMTRQSISVGGQSLYGSTSIAQALIDDGVLTNIITDPLYTNTSQYLPLHNDYVLALCRDTGEEPQTKAQATDFAIYIDLEKPDATEQATAKQICGGSQSRYPRVKAL